MAPPVPQTIGRYDIVSVIGRGGMGVLYRARDPVLERDVALKMMLIDFSFDQSARERFEREAKAVARLQHHNVVTIHELGQSDGTPYIVMELLGGDDLETVMHRPEPLPLPAKLEIVAQLCEGLAYAHEQGIVHRDIKPGNVRVLEDGTVKILDFGIAKFAQSSMTQSGAIMGTASYMAPEQIMGSAVDGRADLFSVGVLLHELLSGQKPFAADSPTAVVYQIVHTEAPPLRQAAPGLPDELDQIVARALKKDPNERYARATDMASDLRLVKMMLDLPMTPPPMAPTGSVTLGPLHATGVVARAGGGPAAAGAAKAAAGPAPAAAADAGGRPAPRANTGLLAGAAVALVVIAAGAYFALGGSTARDSGAGPSPAATATAAATPAAAPAAPAGGTGRSAAAASAGAATPAEAAPRASPKAAREPAAVKVTVTAAFAFEIRQRGAVISESATHHEIAVRPGGALSVRSDELFLNEPLAIDFQKPEPVIALRAPGTLAVFAANETCSILINGRDVGFPPLPGKPIAAGPHTVTLRCADGKEDSRKIVIASGERTAVTFRMPESR